MRSIRHTNQMARGLDGLTVDELRRSRLGWWDAAFTRTLLDLIPAGTRRIVDVGCGIGIAAHALLPALAAAEYLGVDPDQERLAEAAALAAGSAYAARLRLVCGVGDRLPFDRGTADLILSSMTLQHVADPGAALTEAARVLAIGGCLLAVEPDNLSNAFFFDGRLDAVNTAFQRLFASQREARRPADTAIGPAVPALAERAGLVVRTCRPYALGLLQRQPAGEFLRGARQVARIAAPSGEFLQACETQLDSTVEALGPERLGFGGQVVTVFITLASSGTPG